MDIRAPSPAQMVGSERTAAPGSNPRLDALLGNALFLDLETNRQGAIHKIGAQRNGRDFFRQGRFRLEEALADLEAFADEAEVVVGHNLLGHDLPTLRALAPALRLLDRPILEG